MPTVDGDVIRDSIQELKDTLQNMENSFAVWKSAVADDRDSTEAQLHTMQSGIETWIKFINERENKTSETVEKLQKQAQEQLSKQQDTLQSWINDLCRQTDRNTDSIVRLARVLYRREQAILYSLILNTMVNLNINPLTYRFKYIDRSTELYPTISISFNSWESEKNFRDNAKRYGLEFSVPIDDNYNDGFDILHLHVRLYVPYMEDGSTVYFQ